MIEFKNSTKFLVFIFMTLLRNYPVKPKILVTGGGGVTLEEAVIRKLLKRIELHHL